MGGHGRLSWAEGTAGPEPEAGAKEVGWRGPCGPLQAAEAGKQALGRQVGRWRGGAARWGRGVCRRCGLAVA